MWTKDPSVVFLAETLTDKVRLEQVQRCIQFKNLFMVPHCNKAGGLAILWKEGFPLEVVKFSKNYIDFVINKGKENAWRFTGFYGEPNTTKRHEAWSKLQALKDLGSLPWLCVGDFNEIPQQAEKQGGDLGLIIKCRLLEIFLMSVVLWTLILFVFHSLGTNIIPILLYGKD